MSDKNFSSAWTLKNASFLIFSFEIIETNVAAETEQRQFEHFLVGNHFIVNEDVSTDERIDPV